MKTLKSIVGLLSPKKTAIFVGYGKMGSIVGKMFLKNGVSIHAVDPNFTSNNETKNLTLYKSINDLPANLNPEYIVFCVKPQSAKNCLPEYKRYTKSLFISIMAGIDINTMEKMLFENAKIIRTMPNIGLDVNEGLVVCASSNTARECMSEINILFDNKTIWISKEELFHISTAIAGSGIAFMACIFDCIKKIGVSNGLSNNDSSKMTLSIFSSVVELLNSGLAPENIMSNIASKGGTTEAGLKILNENIYEILEATIESAKQKSIQLSK